MTSATDLIDSVKKQLQLGRTADWRKVREEIVDAHGRATSIAERVLCLDLHKAIMDAVERQGVIAPEDLEKFRDVRRRDYLHLLVQESMIGLTDGHLNAQKIAEITRREVKAGRLAEDDELHELAEAAAMVLGSPPVPHRGSVSERIKGWWRGFKVKHPTTS
jgi:hypothetical protein